MESMIIRTCDIRREMYLLRFDEEYIENVFRIIKESGEYEDKYISIHKLDNGCLLYHLK